MLSADHEEVLGILPSLGGEGSEIRDFRKASSVSPESTWRGRGKLVLGSLYKAQSQELLTFAFFPFYFPFLTPVCFLVVFPFLC